MPPVVWCSQSHPVDTPTSTPTQSRRGCECSAPPWRNDAKRQKTRWPSGIFHSRRQWRRCRGSCGQPAKVVVVTHRRRRRRRRQQQWADTSPRDCSIHGPWQPYGTHSHKGSVISHQIWSNVLSQSQVPAAPLRNNACHGISCK
jgi:hypothetical protein